MHKPQMIRPYHEWARDVLKIHLILKDKHPTLVPFWWECYRNNESPFIAYLHNIEFTGDPSKWVDTLTSHANRNDRFFVTPYAGIGDERPYKDW